MSKSIGKIFCFESDNAKGDFNWIKEELCINLDDAIPIGKEGHWLDVPGIPRELLGRRFDQLELYMTITFASCLFMNNGLQKVNDVINAITTQHSSKGLVNSELCIITRTPSSCMTINYNNFARRCHMQQEAYQNDIKHHLEIKNNNIGFSWSNNIGIYAKHHIAMMQYLSGDDSGHVWSVGIDGTQFGMTWTTADTKIKTTNVNWAIGYTDTKSVDANSVVFIDEIPKKASSSEG